MPDEVKPTLDAIRADARTVADAAARVCAAQYTSGRFTVTATGCGVNKLPGEDLVPTIPSPAKGTPLEGNPMVLDVQVFCYAPNAGKTGESCGSGLAALRTPPFAMPGAGRTRNMAESNCKESPTSCEEVVVPSQYVKDEKSADLRVIKPVVGGPAGATAEVTILLGKK